MQRLLWLTAEVPDRIFGGSSIREHFLLKAMVTQARVDLVTPRGMVDADIRAAVNAMHEVDDYHPPPRRTLARRLGDLAWGLFDNDPLEVRDRRHMVRQVIDLELDLDAYDVVVVEHIALAWLVPATHRNRWVLNTCVLGSRRAAHQLPVTPPGRRRWLVAKDLQRSRRFEAWAAAAYDVVVVASREDADALPGGPVVVPNGADVDSFRPTPLPKEPRVILGGSLDTLANVDGARWFATEVWPRVRDEVPDANLDIVGRNPTPAVQELAADSGIHVHADVPSMAAFLDRARVAVVPLRIGSGTRLKALEAMAAGRPVAGTSIGLEGIDPGSTLALVADTPGALADAVVRLLRDDTLAAGLVTAARAEVETRYSWTAIGARFARIVLSPSL